MKHFTSRLTLAIFFLTSISFDCRSQIYGTNTLNNASFGSATTVDGGIIITETANFTDMNVQISGGFQSGDILSLQSGTSLPSGITTSYDNVKGVFHFYGNTTPSDWQYLLRRVQYSHPSGSCYSENRSISFVLGNKYVNLANGHYYALGNNQPWLDALSDANSSSYFGKKGYLATVTTVDENNFLFNVVVNGYSWLGGSDDYSLINIATGSSTYSNQAASDGNFYWVTGPESGTQFSSKNAWQSGGPSSISGRFMNWASNEPSDGINNSNIGEENYIHFFNNSEWNDLNGLQSFSPIIEFGDMPSDAANKFPHFTRNLRLSSSTTGYITGNTNICIGSSTSLSLTSSSLTFISWESSDDQFFNNPTTVSTSSSPLNISSLSQNNYFRAVVNSSGCGNIPTASVYVTVNNANGTWTGGSGVNDEWTRSTNWCGGVPTLTTDVIIPPGNLFTPNVNNDAVCRNIKILQGGTLTFNANQNLEIYGSISGNHSIDASSGDLFLKGNSSQILLANAFLNNEIDDITINNINNVTLAGNLLILNDLRFTAGVLNTSATSIITIDNGANAISGANLSPARFVNGPLRKLGTSDFTFEVGKGGKYAPCRLENISNVSNQYFTAEYFNNPFDPYSINSSQLGWVSGKEVWNINRAVTSGSADVILYYPDLTYSGIIPGTNPTTGGELPNKLIIVHHNGTLWENANTNSASGVHTVNAAGTPFHYAKTTGVASFSPFTFGSNLLNPLPVSLINFVAIPDNTTKTVVLNWETVSEENNKYFEVMHSTDFITWKSIGTVNSKGTNAQMNNYTFNHMNPASVNHYKLKEVANNGDYSYSDIKLARFSDIADGKVSIYPNPSVGSITVANAAEETNFEITDITGKIIRTGNFNHTIQIDNLPKGVYIIKIVSEGFIQNDKIVIQ